MNSRWHFYISIIKSLIRMISCVAAVLFKNILILPVGLFLAELLGMLEEVGDER